MIGADTILDPAPKMVGTKEGWMASRFVGVVRPGYGIGARIAGFEPDATP
jgi:hypothetical protein